MTVGKKISKKKSGFRRLSLFVPSCIQFVAQPFGKTDALLQCKGPIERFCETLLRSFVLEDKFTIELS